MQAVVAKKTPTPRAIREMARRHFKEEYHGTFTGSLIVDEVGVPSCRVGVASCKVGVAWSAW